MPTPIEAYRQGYEKGRSDNAGGRLAEVTMGMLRDDPGGHFQKGYSDGAADKAFDPPSIPAPNRSRTSGLIPKFSENPGGWFLAVAIVVECWVLWQLIKAPFQLIGSLMRRERPSPWVIVKNAILVGLAIALVWWVPHVNEMRGPASYTQAVQPPNTVPSGSAPLTPSIVVDVPDNAPNTEKILGRWKATEGEDLAQPEFFPNGRKREMSESCGGGPNGCPGRYEFIDESHVNVDGFTGPIALQITGREMHWVFPNGMRLSFRLERRGNEHLAGFTSAQAITSDLLERRSNEHLAGPDPAKPADQRAKILGKWQDVEAAYWTRYEFRPDGTYSWLHSAGTSNQGKFSITTPGTLTLDGDPQKIRFEGDALCIGAGSVAGETRYTRYTGDISSGWSPR